MESVRLIVELEAGEPIAGWVDPPSGPRERFAGLLELVAMLDRLRGVGERREALDDGQTG